MKGNKNTPSLDLVCDINEELIISEIVCLFNCSLSSYYIKRRHLELRTYIISRSSVYLSPLRHKTWVRQLEANNVGSVSPKLFFFYY